MAKATLIKSCSSSCSAVFKRLLKQLLLKQLLNRGSMERHGILKRVSARGGEPWVCEFKYRHRYFEHPAYAARTPIRPPAHVTSNGNRAYTCTGLR